MATDFAELFGLLPWDIDRLNIPQWERFVERRNRRVQEAAQAKSN